MSYLKSHKESECDKCLKDVGVKNLKPIPFLYLDRNDHIHPNLGRDYHQYYCCKECYKIECKAWKTTN